VIYLLLVIHLLLVKQFRPSAPFAAYAIRAASPVGR
jgi:hypothetical protein